MTNSAADVAHTNTILVSSTKELLAAIKSATGGETILLAPGSYDRVQITNKAFSSEVTIKSADADHPAMIKGVVLNHVANLTFDHVDVTHQPSQAGIVTARAFNVMNSSSISLTNSNVHGSVDGNFGNDGIGAGFMNSNDVTLTGNTFHDLHRGAVIDNAVGVNVSNNSVYDIRSDGFDFSEARNVVIDSNNFGQFRSAATNAVDHPGIIQFWTNGDTKANENIVISNNVSLQSSFDGWPIGGIFMRDEKGNLPYRNVLIENNVIYTRDSDTITLGHAIGATIRNNTVLSVAGSDEKASIHVWDRSQDVVVENNISNGLILRADSAVKSSGNTLVQWEDPNRPGYYGDNFVNALNATKLADLIPIPGSASAPIGSALLSAMKDHPPVFIEAHANNGTIGSLTNVFSIESFQPGKSLPDIFGKTATFEWSFGDGTKATGMSASHTYERGGLFDVFLTVKDGAHSVTFNKSVAVVNPVLLDLKFDGNVIDSSDKARITDWQGKADFDAHGTGKAALFDGGKTNTAVVVHEADDLSGLKQMTLSFDFKADGKGDGRMVWLHGSFGVEMTAGKLSVMTVGENGVAQWTKVGDTSMLDQRWHSLTLRYDGINGELDILVDGNLAGRTVGQIGALAEVTTGRDLTIGGAFGRNFIGDIDNVKIVQGVDKQVALPLASDADGVTLRGSAIADTLLNKQGNDVFRSGLGADQIKFDKATIGHGDVDRILDIDFKGGDKIIFSGFETGTFQQITGGNVLQITDNGRGALIDSFADIKELVQATHGAITATRSHDTDLQLDFHQQDGVAHQIIIANGWLQY